MHQWYSLLHVVGRAEIARAVSTFKRDVDPLIVLQAPHASNASSCSCPLPRVHWVRISASCSLPGFSLWLAGMARKLLSITFLHESNSARCASDFVGAAPLLDPQTWAASDSLLMGLFLQIRLPSARYHAHITKMSPVAQWCQCSAIKEGYDRFKAILAVSPACEQWAP